MQRDLVELDLLAVLDRDLFDRGAGEILEAGVVGTFVEGVSVYETPDLGG